MLAGIGMLTLIWPITLAVRHSPESMGLLPDGDQAADYEESLSPKDTETSPIEAPARPEASLSLASEVNFTIRQAFGTIAMWQLIAAITLRFTAHTAIMVNLAPILEDRGMTPIAAAGAIGILVFLSIPGRIAVGWLGDRFAKRKVIASLLIVQAFSMLILIQANSIWQLYIFIAVWAAAYGAGILNWAIVGDYFGRANFATLRGLMGLVFSGGAVLGPLYAGWVYDTTGAYTTAILVFMVITSTSIPLYWFCVPPRNPNIIKSM